ncbi:MAG TPA: protein DpdJ [Armatimonadota bacterium]|jgi:hypothetical protein
MSQYEEQLERSALALLDRLEADEWKLLTWGFLDGGFTDDDLIEAAQAFPSTSSPEDLIAWLRKRRSLFDIRRDTRRINRTRFAESVRLIVRLKQILPWNDWRTAPNLVSDYRVAIRPRLYPPRDVLPEAALDLINQRRRLSPIEERTYEALLAHRGSGPFRFSRFQVRAAARLLGSIGGPTKAMIVCAGTGTGKTLAFYLPCLMSVVRGLDATESWTQALAVYPRRELLKDQFTEAYREARRTDTVAISSPARRKVILGAYFGDTPTRAEWDFGWQPDPAKTGRVCPYLRCPAMRVTDPVAGKTEPCDADMVWRDEQRLAGVEELRCTRPGCEGRVCHEEVILTRSRMEKTPPDILFTTTEMLNREMSNTWAWRLFGINRPSHRSPSMLLLDEVHTYHDVHGAQVSLLIRRWRHLVGQNVQFVGLSATLADPQGFFSDMLGVPHDAVEVLDAGEELLPEGREYHLVLRGDPVSQTSLLATSIQTAMLLPRVLDVPGQGISGGIYGHKVFAFTDDLDVTNRFFHDLLDAEGRNSFGQPYTSKQSLASFRAAQLPEKALRFDAGQCWDICEYIGHDLGRDNRLKVGRTSSQDPGVQEACNVIIATPSLEVGYNDQGVGAVLQHKAPRDPASFLQRRGRAGRSREMRPWTVVVLSDYGRDRLAYQAYDQLFDPVIERRALPIRNRYVLRIQATYAFMEWLARLLPMGVSGSVWDDLVKPAKDARQRQRQDWICGVVLDVLQGGPKRDALAMHLSAALGLTEDEVSALFWEPPRPLLLAVLPTVWRRLSSQWNYVRTRPDESAQEYYRPSVPLHEFIPDNLFSDLNVPDVVVTTPAFGNGDAGEWAVDLGQALRTLPPGRVTRRFGVRHAKDAHWVAPPELDGPDLQEMMVDAYCAPPYESVGTFQVRLGGSVNDVMCVRPWAIKTALCPMGKPDNVLASSNARMEWRSQVFADDIGENEGVPSECGFDSFIQDVRFCTHNLSRPSVVRRFSLGSRADVRRRGKADRSITIRFTEPEDRGEPGAQAAVGFEQCVDGIRFLCRISDDAIGRALSNPEVLRSSRTAYFRDSVTNDDELRKATQQNAFLLDWLALVFLSMLLARAGRSQVTLREAISHYSDTPEWDRSVSEALSSIFQTLPVNDEEDEGFEGIEEIPTGKLQQRLLSLFQDTNVRDRLLRLAMVLHGAVAIDKQWIRQRFTLTLGAAFQQACYALTPQNQAGELCLDIDPGPPPSGGEELPEGLAAIWITETVLGGTGVVEEIYQQYRSDPRYFYLLAEMALSPSDHEVVDEELTNAARLSQSSSALQEAFAQVRRAENNHELDVARGILTNVLNELGVLVTRPVMTALNARVLRPGTGPDTDALLSSLLDSWAAEEERLGVEIDARVFCYCASRNPEIADDVSRILSSVGGGGDSSQESASILYALLWPRGSVVREKSLEVYNPYANFPRPDPLLLFTELRACLLYVPVDDPAVPDWEEVAREALATRGSVRLFAGATHSDVLQVAILRMVVNPIELHFLRLFPYVVRAERIHGGRSATLHLREVLQ